VHGEKTLVYGDAAYRGPQNCTRAKAAGWTVAKCRASVRTKVKYLSRVIDRQVGFAKARYRGLKKKHRTTDNAVRAVRSPDGAPEVVENVSGRRLGSDPQKS
jgi:hypothetical protein